MYLENKMVSSASRRIKLSVNLRPFVSRVVRSGRAQIDFAVGVGEPVGQCVSGQTKGKVGVLSGADIHKIAKECAAPYRGRSIKGAGAARYKAKLRAMAPVAREFFEVE